MKTENKLILGAFVLLIVFSWISGYSVGKNQKEKRPVPQESTPAMEGWWDEPRIRLVPTNETQVGENISDAGQKPVTTEFTLSGIGTPKNFVYPNTVTTVAEFKVEAKGDIMLFKLPRLIFRKTGGAPWKSLEDVGRNIYLPVVEWSVGRIQSPAGDDNRGLAGFTLIDENSVAVNFPQEDYRAIILDPNHAYLFKIVASVGHSADMQTISVSMDPGVENVVGSNSKRKFSSGAMVGPTLIIRYD